MILIARLLYEITIPKAYQIECAGIKKKMLYYFGRHFKSINNKKAHKTMGF